MSKAKAKAELEITRSQLQSIPVGQMSSVRSIAVVRHTEGEYEFSSQPGAWHNEKTIALFICGMSADDRRFLSKN